MTADALIWATLAAVALTGATAVGRLLVARRTADVVLLLQLLSAKAIAAFALLSVLYGEPSLAETALALALLGAVGAAVFAHRRRS